MLIDLRSRAYYIQDPDLEVNDQSDFSPRAEFNRTDVDLTFLFLRLNSAIFSFPCEDPWFSAHVNFTTWEGDATRYWADKPASIVGCAEQVYM